MSDANESKRLGELSRVLELSLSRDGDELSLFLRMREEGTNAEISYAFSAVSDLRFRGERTELKELVLLLSEDASRDGWERVRFRVKDYEEEFISFLCGDMRRLR